MRALRSLGILPFFAALAACGGFDVGDPYHMRPAQSRASTDPAGGDDADDDGATGEASSGDDTDEGDDAGPQTIVPSGDDGDATNAPSNAFTDAPAYVATSGATTRKAQHDFAGATPTTNPAGRACMQCHGAAGPAPRFLVAGTVYRDATGKPAPQVEIRVVGADGIARTTYSNADGNFFFAAASGAVKFPAKVGARDGDTTKFMTIDATNGNCNSCHRAGGTTPPLVVE